MSAADNIARRTRAREASERAQSAISSAVAAANAPVPDITMEGNNVDVTLVLKILAQQNRTQQLQTAASLLQAQAAMAQSELAAAESLAQQARAAAGTPPIFNGTPNNIEVHRWLIAIERWFESAYITPDNDKQRVTIAASVLRNASSSWWQGEVAAGRSNINWKPFRRRDS